MKKTIIPVLLAGIVALTAFTAGKITTSVGNSVSASAYTQLPIGTVITSMLDYQKLCSQVGEQPQANPAVNTFMPCDGRTIIGSTLASLYTDQSMNMAPDFRGKFARGLNIMHATGQPGIDINLTGDPEGTGRRAGNFQPDEVKHHSHGASAVLPSSLATSNGTLDADGGSEKFNCNGNIAAGTRASVIVDENSGKESRPRNIAVYYYIKVN